jgi:zinc protease
MVRPTETPRGTGRSLTVAGLAPVRSTLDNRLVTIVKETRKTPIVALNLAIRAGSVCDPIDAPGAVYLLSRVIDRGTATRSPDQIAEALDSRAVSLNAFVSRHLFSLVCTCLSADFDFIFDLVSDIVMNPSVPENELERRKGEVVTALRQDEDNPFVRAGEGLMAALYGTGHPYGRRVKGTTASVEALSRERLLTLHRQRFAPGEVTAVIVGDVDAGRVRQEAERLFGGWRQPESEPVRVAPPPQSTARNRVIIPMMNKAQADVAYGFVALARSDPQYYSCWLMNHIIGQYAIGGRLGDRIREREGMAYYAGSSFDADLLESPLAVRAGVSPANVDRALASIDDELSMVRKGGLTGKELNESRQYLVGSMPRALETNSGIAHFLQISEVFGLGLDYDIRLPELLSAVTLDEVNAMARRLLDPSRATIVIAGPYER